jgi:RNA recognition motif-containing protein
MTTRSKMSIYVSNLPLELTENELRQEFSVFGEVKAVNLITDTFTGSRQPRMYAFVEMEERSEGEAAILQLQGKEIMGREIEVIAALPLSSEKDRKAFYRTKHSWTKTRKQPGFSA